MKNYLKGFRYVSSFLVGGVVGAGLALWFAPMTGKKMQRQVTKMADKVVDSVSDKVGDFKAAAQRMAG